MNAQLGHSNSTARKFYLREDHRHAIEGSIAMMTILEEEGEKLWVEPPKTLWDPVSDYFL